MTPPPRPFHDVDDPFRFVRRALEDELRARCGTLRPDMREEAEGYFLEILVRLARRYDPWGSAATRLAQDRIRERVATRHEWRALHRYLRARVRALRAGADSRAAGQEFAATIRRLGLDPGRPLAFSTWAYRILRRRYTDFLRDERGDRRYGNDGREVAMAETPREGVSEDRQSFEALIESIDHEKLSPLARGALRQIALLMARDDLTATQAAARLGKSRREVKAAMDRLRLELFVEAA